MVLDEEHYYNDNIGKETLNREYKSFSMHAKGTGISEDDALEYLKSGKFIFSKYVYKNILFYLNKYFIKYMTAFNNSLIDKAELWYGVNDDGVLTGIPLLNEIEKNVIFDYINTICKDINTESLYEVKIIKLKKRKTTYDSNDIYNKWYNMDMRYRKCFDKFNKHMRKVSNVITIYTEKLNRMLCDPDTQRELLIFVYNCLRNKNLDLFRRIKKKILRKDKLISNITFQQLAPHKVDINSIYYWLVKFKDERIQFLKSLKPIKPNPLMRIHPNSIISQIEPMIPLWLSKNRHLNLYVIKIIFNIDKKKIMKIFNNTKYIKYKRVLDIHKNPCVIKI
jgi:hypothetical protein